ncbi:MAG: hypothetical protein KAW12_06975 [Candidatus Aminicenantes bacterium]|nr:hypothetical protein [Candidatus Aminicenantes bacterium]
MVGVRDVIGFLRRENRLGAISYIRQGLTCSVDAAKETLAEIEKDEGFYISCPSCGSKNAYFLHGRSVSVCLRCNAIFGKIKRQDMKEFVDYERMGGHSGNVHYFDFKITDEDIRTHGWYDPETKIVAQWG